MLQISPLVIDDRKNSHHKIKYTLIKIPLNVSLRRCPGVCLCNEGNIQSRSQSQASTQVTGSAWTNKSPESAGAGAGVGG